MGGNEWRHQSQKLLALSYGDDDEGGYFGVFTYAPLEHLPSSTGHHAPYPK
ncbi:hypothetical protein M407DRAFT_35021 [Tulasnella calospora MUT 4182]|uniref:Uncharacterized protein n=1 Tax=Tulasnella calospora MUT 4182 TaxID=1051891 RepID=A0A0C3Q0F5_9AGAM|nr:hypothetical protein M407DRAFT_35021 [Tulasnella calospora MUT 4182]